MKNLSCLILTLLFMTLTFTPNSLTQTPQDDPQQGDFPDDVKVRSEKVNIYDIKYSPDGTRLAVAGDFGILLYDVRTDDKPVKVTGNTGRAWNIAFCPDGNILASASPYGTIRLLDTNTGQLLRTLKGNKKLWIWGVSFSPDGKMIASRHNEVVDSTLRLWDADTGKLLRTLSGHTRQISAVSFSPDGRIIASGSHDKTLRLWDADTGKLLHTLSGHTRQISAVSFSPDGRIISSGSGDCTVRLWNVNTGQLLRTFEDWKIPIASVAYSPDGDNRDNRKLQSQVTVVLLSPCGMCPQDKSYEKSKSEIPVYANSRWYLVRMAGRSHLAVTMKFICGM